MTRNRRTGNEGGRRSGRAGHLLAAAVAVPLGVAAVAGAVSGQALAATRVAHVVAFAGHYTGTASVLINNGAATISSVTGSGTGTAALVGASTLSGSGSAAASALCDPFGGTGAITGKIGTIKFVVARSTSQGCSSGQSGPVTVTFKGVAKATGGTGKDKGAKGNLSFRGTLKLDNTSGSQSGTFTVTLRGKLAV